MLLFSAAVLAWADDYADIPLAEPGEVSFSALRKHVRRKNPAIDDIYLDRLYDDYADVCRVEGVSLVAALAQMVHETDYLRFTGAVRAVQYNYAGIGATGGDEPGARFSNMRVGVTAHVQHIKAYATLEPTVLPLADPRFSYVQRGSATSVMALAGRWATDPLYGEKLMAHVAALRVHDE